MKTHTLLSLLALFAAAPVFAATPSSLAPAGADRAAALLARQGTVAVEKAGPYVGAGTFRVQVAAKLGRPDAVLADGSWLYNRHEIEGSRAVGTLVLRFRDGRVSALALVTPAVAVALRDNPTAAPHELVAAK